MASNNTSNPAPGAGTPYGPPRPPPPAGTWQSSFNRHPNEFAFTEHTDAATGVRRTTLAYRVRDVDTVRRAYEAVKERVALFGAGELTIDAQFHEEDWGAENAFEDVRVRFRATGPMAGRDDQEKEGVMEGMEKAVGGMERVRAAMVAMEMERVKAEMDKEKVEMDGKRAEMDRKKAEVDRMKAEADEKRAEMDKKNAEIDEAEKARWEQGMAKEIARANRKINETRAWMRAEAEKRGKRYGAPPAFEDEYDDDEELPKAKRAKTGQQE